MIGLEGGFWHTGSVRAGRLPPCKCLYTGYEPYRAQQKAADRLKRPKPRKAAEGTRLWDEIAAGLRRHWSPEQIANRLRLDFPDNGDMHASVETIYQAIYLQARGELKQELKRAMRQGRTARRPQGGQGRKPRFREPMAMISERPPEIEDRAVPGHWEGDLITGSRNKSAIGTLVERTTRFTILLHLPDGHDAEHVKESGTLSLSAVMVSSQIMFAFT